VKNDRGRLAHCHNLETGQVVALLETNLESGLSANEGARRRHQYGPNQLRAAAVTPAWKRLLVQFQQPLVYILLAATLFALYLGEYVDAAVIAAVVIVNALVGFWQEAKAETAIHALKRTISAEATVRRDGLRQRIAVVELVPGDVVLLEPGDRIPADLRLFRARNLHIDESLLTGESLPVHKHSDPLALETVLADRKNAGFAGTFVTSGSGEGVVWAIGNQTEMGRIAALISEAEELSTPLTRKLAQFSRALLWFILALAILTVAVGLWHGEKPIDMFMAAIALAVGATPEGLPAAVTITLAIGVARMARRRAIVRKLAAVETLGSTTMICSDKTGTLTQNAMTVRESFAGGEMFEVTGNGYEPVGSFKIDMMKAIVPKEHPALMASLRAGLLCNDATIKRGNGAVRIQGDPTEAALIVAAERAGLLRDGEPTRIDVIPFESEQRFMATLHRHPRGHHILYKKGAVERLVSRCTTMFDAAGRLTKIDKEKIFAAADSMAAKGLRVLAFAQRELEPHQHHLRPAHVESDLTFLGLQGMMDPPRPEAITAVARCQRAGIAVKMITGDHLLTAKHVARQLGIRHADSAILGRDLDKIDNQRLPGVVERTAVFARVAPEQKLRLVRALQKRHHVVAMTGDGVNDAPALKQADIGVAMGMAGTDVAKGVADMVLADDNFASIEAAVEEGRNVFDNLTKFIVWTLPTNAGEALLLITAILLATPLPALPLQLLWINMSETIFGLPLAFEPKEPGLMERPPRDPRQPIFTNRLVVRTIVLSILMMAGAFALFAWELNYEHASIAQARTVVINLIIAIEAFYLFNCRSWQRARIAKRIPSNPWLFLSIAVTIVIQLLFTYTSFMNGVFDSAPIAPDAWLRVIAVAFVCFVVIGVEKRIRFSPARAWKTATRTHTSPLWRRALVFCTGGAVLFIGIIMLILPGPAIVFIPLGLAILATEFRWAKNWLTKTRRWIWSHLRKSCESRGGQ
jgi:cation-transporting P-type ATPase F